MSAISFEDSKVLGRYTEPANTIASLAKIASAEEIKAAYEHITELKISLAEMVLIYWVMGKGLYQAAFNGRKVCWRKRCGDGLEAQIEQGSVPM